MLLIDPDRARVLGAAGRARMERSWTLPAQVTRLQELLAGALTAW